MSYTYTREDIKISDIPITIYSPVNIDNPTTVVYYHGWSSSVEKFYLLGEIFASKGIQFIMPEIPDHGDRGEMDYSTFTGALDIAISGANEYKLFIDELTDRYSINELYISGHSLGGLISALIVNDNKADGIIIYNSFYDIEEFIIEIVSNPIYKDTFSPSDIEKLESLIDTVSVDRLNEIKYIINVGTQDSVIDPKFMLDLNCKLLSMNIDNGVFNYYSDQGHGIGYKMIRDTLRIVGGDKNE